MPLVISIKGINSFGIVNNPDKAEKKIIYPHIIAMLFVLTSTESTKADDRFCFEVLEKMQGFFFSNKLSITQTMIDDSKFVMYITTPVFVLFNLIVPTAVMMNAIPPQKLNLSNLLAVESSISPCSSSCSARIAPVGYPPTNPKIIAHIAGGGSFNIPAIGVRTNSKTVEISLFIAVLVKIRMGSSDGIIMFTHIFIPLIV
ncbi:hypothetical protein [uncultured Eubacterium sp.]|uniref:hypothetical protein n=1 Tax=uncultured Eubacterium sp. TaxID=165185 RepID=UPI00261A9139|nr:hypothetical protein [uncultured Eubacterium sp.]